MDGTGRTTGGVRSLLRLEAFVLFGVSLVLYQHVQGDWLQFLKLFLLPDIAIAATLFGPRAGAAAYNATHTTLGPIALAACGQFGLALIWLAHIGLDRALGFGLKYQTGFRHTHL